MISDKRISGIRPQHYRKILELNAEFVHWLSPLDAGGLSDILARSDYARQIEDASGVLIGYAHDVKYPDHSNLAWLRARLESSFISTE